MNYFFSLPNDIKSHIYFFIKTSCANSIISSWRRYIFHKKFIIYSIYSLPKFYSFIDYDLIYSVVFINTYFFFKKLYNITTGNESYFSDIHHCFYLLAISIDDYEWVIGHDNLYYAHNKFYCISIALKFKWNDILQLLL
tara:strand:+ start:1555 stop:1971 length:417 start_codon:yes stop_codon:yes gene_type:complete